LNSKTLLAALFVVLALSVVGTADQVAAQPERQIDYRGGTDYLPQTPSVTAGALGGLVNPAAWATGDGRESAFWWNDRNLRPDALDNFGFANAGKLGLAFTSQVFGLAGQTHRVNDLQIGLAGGGRDGNFGVAYRWATGANELLGRESALVVGTISRPNRWLSLGMSGQFSTATGARQGVFDLGVRPLGNGRLALFADFSLGDGDKLGNGIWGGGVEVRPVDGLSVGARVHQDPAQDDYLMSLSCGITFGGRGLYVLPSYDQDRNHTHTTFLWRSRSPVRDLGVDLPLSIDGGSRYAVLDLENKVLTYQKYRLFDDRRVAWLDLARWLEAVEGDESIDGIVLNLFDFRARPSLAWELRQQLEQLQAGGMEIIIHTGRMGMLEYYLASVADGLTTDPQGGMSLPGFALSRTYLKDMLDKLGVGFQEFRYFTHKSAAEALSRTSMSEADREQRQRIVDVLYDVVRKGVCEGRDLSLDAFDAVVDDQVMVNVEGAVEMGLVDEVTRWTELVEAITERGGRFVRPARGSLAADYPEEHWGQPAKIAVVFAVGGCDMDTGIKGRATSEYLRKLVGDPDVAAVVLRADSPGGDPLPSDLVAQAVTKLREAGKPVIISQGDVAASGGYWISMTGERILTTPVTITGSVGVIGGWVYDDGLGEKAGLTTDRVQVGAHADLFTNLRFPVLGGLPVRPLAPDELDMIKKLILEMYDEFVAKVAEGRDLPEDEVRKIAEGRVWMGGDAIDNKLCDEFGGLLDAIALAKRRAGLPEDREVELVEYPRRPLFEMPAFGPRLPGAFAFAAPIVDFWQSLAGGATPLGLATLLGSDPAPAVDTEPGGLSGPYSTAYLQALAAENGRPLLLTPPENLPIGWSDQSK